MDITHSRKCHIKEETFYFNDSDAWFDEIQNFPDLMVFQQLIFNIIFSLTTWESVLIASHFIMAVLVLFLGKHFSSLNNMEDIVHLPTDFALVRIQFLIGVPTDRIRIKGLHLGDYQ